MTKQYVSPLTTAVRIQAQAMLALSLTKTDKESGQDEEIGGSGALSDRKGIWSSSNWAGEDEE